MINPLLQLKNNILNSSLQLNISKEIGYYNYFDYKIEYINIYNYKVIFYYYKIIPFYNLNLPNDIIRNIIKYSKEYFKIEFNIYLDNNYPCINNYIYIDNIDSNYIRNYYNYTNIINNFKILYKLKKIYKVEDIILNLHNDIKVLL